MHIMPTLTEVEETLHQKHVEAPITIRKIVEALQNNTDVMHMALNYYHQGKLSNYHLEE